MLKLTSNVRQFHICPCPKHHVRQLSGVVMSIWTVICWAVLPCTTQNRPIMRCLFVKPNDFTKPLTSMLLMLPRLLLGRRFPALVVSATIRSQRRQSMMRRSEAQISIAWLFIKPFEVHFCDCRKQATRHICKDSIRWPSFRLLASCGN